MAEKPKKVARLAERKSEMPKDSAPLEMKRKTSDVEAPITRPLRKPSDAAEGGQKSRTASDVKAEEAQAPPVKAEEAVKEEPIKEEPVKEEKPVKAEPVKEKPAKK